MKPLVHNWYVLVVGLISVSYGFGEDTARQLPRYIDPQGIQGALMIAGGAN